MTTKLVGYAYPTSPAATRFGFPRGCHLVETMTVCDGQVETRILSGHATKDEALRVAELLPFQWNHMYLKFAA